MLILPAVDDTTGHAQNSALEARLSAGESGGQRGTLTGSGDPREGAGTAASPGTLYVDTDATPAGGVRMWVKAGAADTAWERVEPAGTGRRDLSAGFTADVHCEALYAGEIWKPVVTLTGNVASCTVIAKVKTGASVIGQSRATTMVYVIEVPAWFAEGAPQGPFIVDAGFYDATFTKQADLDVAVIGLLGGIYMLQVGASQVAAPPTGTWAAGDIILISQFLAVWSGAWPLASALPARL